MTLLDRLPPLNKPAKTRTAQSHTGGIKIPIETVQEYLKDIEECPIEHEEFISFETSVRESLEWL